METKISIVWFRQDLRLSDNYALANAAKCGKILPIYILDNCAPPPFKIGSASKIWLHHSLNKLNKSLNKKLNIYIGGASKIIKNLIQQHNIHNVFYNLCYEPWHIQQEREVKAICQQQSVNCEAFNSNYLWRPNEILKNDGSYYKVFTAYKKKSYHLTVRDIITTKKINTIKDTNNNTTLSKLKLLPAAGKTWHQKIEELWDIGERAAQSKLNDFVDNRLAGYQDGRNYPSQHYTSLLSPHLHFGEISPCQIWGSVKTFGYLHAEAFLNEIIWREFSCYLLYHCKALHIDNFNIKFNKFRWRNNARYLTAWQTGNTGYPIVDAGMRQLWQTGYMHNRIRMVVGSFLVKNLNIHWHQGRDWFWDCLIDADLANNSASWQWVAGCGADAAPYFRIFNPITQGEKFDKNGEYTRKFIPELKQLPNKYLFKPWTASTHILKEAGITLGKTYPKPIVDLATSRNKALENYQQLS